MKLSFLSPLYARHGPYACAYLDTSRDIDDPERAIALRWRHLREDLAAQGADMATAAALEHVVGSDRTLPGRHGQAIFAAHGRLALAEELPEPPRRDRARFTMLPDAMPLAVQHAPDIPYAAVAVRREVEDGTLMEDLEVTLEAGRWPISRVSGGDRNRWRMPAASWRQASTEVAAALTALAEHGRAEVVVLSGDAWARSALTRQLPKRLQDRVIGIEDDGRPTDTGRALLEAELDDLFRGRMAPHDRTLLEAFLAQRARVGKGAEGLDAAVAALRRGQARALLVNHPLHLPDRLWVGLAPKQIGLTAAELRTLGVTSAREEPADAALIRAVVGTGAELVVVPHTELRLDDGLGVLLRFWNPAP